MIRMSVKPRQAQLCLICDAVAPLDARHFALFPACISKRMPFEGTLRLYLPQLAANKAPE
jgi:hypothetical protein